MKNITYLFSWFVQWNTSKLGDNVENQKTSLKKLLAVCPKALTREEKGRKKKKRMAVFVITQKYRKHKSL